MWARLDTISPYALRFSLRIRTPGGQPPEGLAWDISSAADKADGLCLALQTSFEAELARDGRHLDRTYRASIGTLPATDLALSIERADGTTISSETYAAAPIAMAARRAVATGAQPGVGVYRMKLGDAVCHELTLQARRPSTANRSLPPRRFCPA